MSYQNYHKHSHWSNVRISDSAVRQEDYAKRAVELGQTILSSVEHGWCGNVYDTIKLAKKFNLKPIIGCEAYWVKNRLDKDRTNAHIVLIARNEIGRQALNDALSEANLTGFYHQPRLDLELLLSLPKDDIIVTTACVAYWNYEDIDEITARLAGHFKHFFLEVQYHNTESQRKTNERILRLKKELNLQLIFGADSHFIYQEHDEIRTAFLNSKGLYYENEEGWNMDFPTDETVYRRFADQCVLSNKDILEAIQNTNVLADLVEGYDSPIFNSEIKMPTLYPDWSQEQKDAEYKRLVYAAWDEYKKNVPAEKLKLYEDEIANEVQTVVDTKMADYFILDHHIIKRGKELGGNLTKTGRGSGISYFTNMLLGFTDIDRISSPVHLYADRFISTSRILESKSLPDIDFNCANVEPFARAQEEILGENHAKPMLAYGTYQKSSAWKLYAKSQGLEFALANAVSEQIQKYENAVKHANEDDRDSIEVRDYIDKEYWDIYEKSADYLGLVTSWSIAPCGYILYDGDIRKQFGFSKIKDAIVANIDGKWAEECAFLKNDLLTVKSIDTIYRAYRRIGTEPPTVQQLFDNCPPTDKCWNIFKTGATVFVNQCEQDWTRQCVMRYAPTNISELAAFIAAIRPGFKSQYKKFEAREPFSFGVKAFDELIQTEEFPHSYIIYQEQAMKSLAFAGIPMSECYTVIKNIAKKRADKVYAVKEKFLAGFTNAIIAEGKSTEVAAGIAQQLWQVIEDSAYYSFNACVSGDTIIQKAGMKKNGFIPTIEEMFYIKNDIKYARENNHLDLHHKYRYSGYGNALSMFENLRVRKNKIVDIRQAGVRDIYRVVTHNGEYIDCTMNHKFPTPLGEKPLSSLNIGDILFVKDNYKKSNRHYPFTNGDFTPNTPKPGECGFQSDDNGATVVYQAYRDKHINNKLPCEDCMLPYKTDCRFEIHHVDFNRTNNTFDNYAWLCPSCHKKRHYQNGRTKIYQKGLRIKAARIKDITYLRTDMTYDVEMAAPAHTIVSQSGLIACNSHAVAMAADSLYGAWLKAHHPLEFYETILKICEEKGDKDRMAAIKDEAESYFDVKFPPYRFGQDNRDIRADLDTNSITNSISAIKGFGKTIGQTLFNCYNENFTDFTDILKYLYAHSVKEAKIRPLVQIDYFEQFGNSKTLSALLDAWELFKEGDAKIIKTDKVGCPALASIMQKKCPTTNTAYRLDDKVFEVLYEYENTLRSSPLPDYSLRDKMKFGLDVLGYIDTITNKEEDRRRLLIIDVAPLPDKKQGTWAYRLGTRSIGTGKTARLTVKADTYKANPIKVGDVLFADELYKNPQGFWYLIKYTKESS